MDLDFIDLLHTTRQKLKTVLKEIGFEEKRRYFVSAETEFIYRVSVPAGPLAVGNELVEKLASFSLEQESYAFFLQPIALKIGCRHFITGVIGSACSRRSGLRR